MTRIDRLIDVDVHQPIASPAWPAPVSHAPSRVLTILFHSIPKRVREVNCRGQGRRTFKRSILNESDLVLVATNLWEPREKCDEGETVGVKETCGVRDVGGG